MSYSRLATHRAMVHDARRNAVYARAIRRHVRPDSVVLDLGAGLGLHGLIAAAAGAGRVYLVEPEPVLQIALDIARTNNLAGRIIAVEGRIEEVGLPEKVDLITSVLTGNLLFSEDLLPSLLKARDRYLKPGGMVLPELAHLVLVPVSAPALHAKYVGHWSQPNHGLDFASVRGFAANEILWLSPDEVPSDRLSTPSVMASIDVRSATHCDCHGAVDYAAAADGECHGLLGWIEIRVGDQWLSADPSQPATHWSPGFLPLDPPLRLEKGERVHATLVRPAEGDWTWTLEARSGTRRHSTFLGSADSTIRLSRMSPDHRPGLSVRGENALHALTLMHTGHTNTEIARILAEAHPGYFASVDEALELARAMALRHGR